ncbi:AAA family ATPase [Andreprevotia chitinilytica]|uniref:AAA family ATPase n=1 Tax=Andreprevotia chitinilytica TaxID=396808 RepID=UPI000557CE1C|nr:AAA family ATPase [Andreprevotia chitinilytica]
MSARFQTGLIVGKFAPLHIGHEALIRAAQAQCERLFIISYSQPELPGCEPEKRERWLKTRFPMAEILVVTPDRIAAWRAAGRQIDPMSDNDAPADVHRHFVAQLCLEVLGCMVDAAFTGEDYGDGFAAVLSDDFTAKAGHPIQVTHVRIDRSQTANRVSGTKLRADIHGQRAAMAPEIYGDFVQRVCLLGGESTGKSTLSIALAAHLDTKYVAEYGRELWEQQGGQLSYDDLLHIAQKQVAREVGSIGHANRYLICDTSPLTTLFYCQHLFGKAEPALIELAQRPYDLVVLCAPDFDFVQDGTRQGNEFRLLQHRWYEAELTQRGTPWLAVTGSMTQRIVKVATHLRPLPGSQHSPQGVT